ncbi:MAG TPA: hypothetical protein VF162_13435 [Streptosporangiaceae bacterium]
MTQPKAPAVPSGGGTPIQPDPPRPVVLAVRLMYAGAAVTAIGVVISVIAVITGGADALRAGHPHATAAQLHATQSALITTAVVSGLLEVGAWLFTARANRGGLKWARIVASLLFALGTANLVLRLVAGGGAVSLVYTLVTWLIGAGAVFFLWQRRSSAWFA